MSDDDEIVIDARLHDGVSRSAERIARKIDDVGDEAVESAAQIEALEAALNKNRIALKKQVGAVEETRAELRGMRQEVGLAGVDQKELAEAIKLTEARLLKEEAAVRKSYRAYKGYTEVLSKAEAEQEKFNDELKTTEDQSKKTGSAMHRLWASMRSGEQQMKRSNREGDKFLNFVKKAFVFVKWGVMAAGVGMLTTAVGGLGAAGYASIAGLSPMVGMLVTIPGIAIAAATSIGVLKASTAGMGEALKLMLDPKADPTKVAEATKNLSKNQIGFLKALVSTADEWKKVRKDIGGAMFKGLGNDWKDISSTYLPIADKYLVRHARMMNDIARDAGDYLQTTQAQQDISKVLGTSTVVSDGAIRGIGNLAKTTMVLVRTASPMLRLASKDFQGGTGKLEKATRSHDKELRGFFLDSYALTKRVSKSLADYAVGLFHIGQEADALSNFIGKNLEDIGKDFRQWSGSDEGRAQVRKWFTDMVPVVEELGKWVPAIAGAIRDVSADTDDFVTVSKDLRTDVLPAVTKTVKEFGDGVFETYQNLKQAGVTGATWRVIKGIGSAIKWTSERLAQAPDGAQKILAFATTAYAAYKIFDKIKATSTIMGMLTGGKLGTGKIPGVPKGVQPVYVVNMGAGGLGGADLPGGGGKGKGGPLAWLKGPMGRVLAGVGITLGLTKGVDVGMEKITNQNVSDDTGKNSIANMLQRIASGSTKDTTSLGGKIAGGQDHIKASKSKLSNPFGLGEGMQELIRLGGDTNLEKAQKNIAAIDAELAKMVESGHAREARTAITNLLEGIRQGGGSQVDFLNSLNKYDAAFKKITDTAKQFDLPADLVIDVSTPGADTSLDAIGKLAKKYDLVPKQIKTVLDLLGYEDTKKKAREIGSELDNAAKPRSVQVKPYLTGSLSELLNNAGLGGYVSPLATGGKKNKKPSDPVRFAGGDTVAGTRYLTGELGPEVWVGKNGMMKMLGLNGPEYRNDLGAGAVLPASATSNPFTGNMGDAPEWARQAYMKAITSGVTAKHGGSGTTVHQSFDVKNNISSNVDVDRANQRMMDKAKREMEERA